MKGYYKRPEVNAEQIKDGWFHTGDIATRDADGYYFIVDRKKDMIIRVGLVWIAGIAAGCACGGQETETGHRAHITWSGECAHEEQKGHHYTYYLKGGAPEDHYETKEDGVVKRVRLFVTSVDLEKQAEADGCWYHLEGDLKGEVTWCCPHTKTGSIEDIVVSR